MNTSTIERQLAGHFAVIFYNKLNSASEKYNQVSDAMFELAKTQRGYLGLSSVRDSENIGITVSYWESIDCIKEWQSNTDHLAAQRFGIQEGYAWYHLVVSEIKYDRHFKKRKNG